MICQNNQTFLLCHSHHEHRSNVCLQDYDISLASVEVSDDLASTPSTYQEANKSQNAPLWIKAMRNEYNAIIANDTYVLVPVPEGCKIVRSKWVYKIEYKANGTIDKYKARLIA